MSRKRGRGAAPAWLALGVVALVLLLTLDDRHVGSVADARQMIWTAVALAETGELGQARGRDFTLPRPGGDAVSRYGLGMSLAQLPAAWLAPRLEAWLGPGTSQPLFLLAPLVSVLLGAWTAGLAARLLGAGAGARAVTVLLVGLGSPLGSYAALGYSEPLQALLLVAAYAASLQARERGSARAALAGLAVGLAVLTKSSLLAVAPFTLLALLGGAAGTSRRRLLGSAALGTLPGLGAWLAFEIHRFGRPFAAYAGEGFHHPLLDGLWRLLVGPNFGLLLFFPAALLALAGLARALRAPGSGRRAAAAGALVPSGVLLVLAASWWAWHGVEGWGPRLLVPSLPLLGAWAGVAAEGLGRAGRRALVAGSLLLNLLPLLQHPTPVATYGSNLRWPAAGEDMARRMAAYAVRRDPDGTLRVSPDQVLATLPRASPFLVYPWFLRARFAPEEEQAARLLETPPWAGTRPDLVPREIPMPRELVRHLLGRRRLCFWGRGFRRAPEEPGASAVYDEGLVDQVFRAQQQRRAERALGLARKLHRLAPGGTSVALVLEGLRLQGRVEEARRFLGGEPVERRRDMTINVVLALFERDRGNEEAARRFLGSAASLYPGTAVERALLEPLVAWPADLASMIAEPTDQVPGGPAWRDDPTQRPLSP